jgi:hypothetical protein
MRACPCVGILCAGPCAFVCIRVCDTVMGAGLAAAAAAVPRYRRARRARSSGVGVLFSRGVLSVAAAPPAPAAAGAAAARDAGSRSPGPAPGRGGGGRAPPAPARASASVLRVISRSASVSGPPPSQRLRGPAAVSAPPRPGINHSCTRPYAQAVVAQKAVVRVNNAALLMGVVRAVRMHTYTYTHEHAHTHTHTHTNAHAQKRAHTCNAHTRMHGCARLPADNARAGGCPRDNAGEHRGCGVRANDGRELGRCRGRW